MILLTSLPGWAALPKPGSTGPVIVRAFAPEVERYGDPLRFYIEAEDPTGDMLRVSTVVDQVGYGQYPTDWVYLPQKDRHRFVGYLQWDTFSYNASSMPEWTQLTVRVSIADTKGHESNAVVFPLEFVSEAVPKAQLPIPFNSANLQKLGYVDINLYNPNEMEVEPQMER